MAFSQLTDRQALASSVFPNKGKSLPIIFLITVDKRIGRHPGSGWCSANEEKRVANTTCRQRVGDGNPTS
jgi:hypothetical protein